MKKFTTFATLAMVMVLALSSFADELPRYTKGNGMIYGGSVNAAKAGGDTVDVMGPEGSGAAYFGNFVTGWNGWYSTDLTKPTTTHWQLSDYLQSGGDQAMWCGDITIVACAASDSVGGYGADWHDLVELRITASNPGIPAAVQVDFWLQNDTEPGYDFTRLSYAVEGQLGYSNQISYDGDHDAAYSETINYAPAEFVGGTEAVILFRVQSDGGWDDGDCSYPTAGACQIDDVTVTMTQTGEADQVFNDNFEGGWGNWAVTFPDGVGDYAQLWSNLEDEDPCATNYSQQVAFIDDGDVVFGTGGSNCITWCYGPEGQIVNTTGGVAGPASHLNNYLFSPVMAWPNASYDGILFGFGVYVHEDLSADAPGMFYTWGIRSADSDDSAGNGAQVLSEEAFQDRNFVYYGGPEYRDVLNDVTDLMNAGRDSIQVRVGAYELGWVWGWDQNDGYPAPYFDNVRIQVFPYLGPGMATRALQLANDGFPGQGEIDLVNLHTNGVRFDMANNISLPTHMLNDPGDSITIDVVPVRSGAVLDGTPTLHWSLNQNPTFGVGERTSIHGMATSGTSAGVPAVGISGIPDPDAWAFDLPDDHFLFPGDELHYYIHGADIVGGDSQPATMPGDITGFGDFSDPLAYNTTFQVRGLPTLLDGAGTQPTVLFWDDATNGQTEWYGTLANLGMVKGVDYDAFHTLAASSGVSNGLGGRSTPAMIDGYDDMLYTSGTLSVNTLSNGDFNNDAGDDLGLMALWLAAGDRDIFMSGDDLASDLGINAGANGLAFMEDYMGVNVAASDIRSFIANQSAPLVLAETIVDPLNNVFTTVTSWIAYGGCASINTFDATETRPGAVRLARFTNPGGAADYTYSAATLNKNAGDRVVSLPYDFHYIHSDPSAKVLAPVATRTTLMSNVLDYFSISGSGSASDVPTSTKFAVSNYPNPFNPSTKISYVMPRAGHLTLKIFNVRGELVKTLIDGQVAASESASVVWNGTNNQGTSVSSGVYFYEARSGSDVVVNKMALVK